MVESWEEYLRRATRNKWIRVSPEDFPVYNKPEYPITYMAQEAAWEFCRRLEKLLALKDAGPDLEAILSLGGPHGKFGDHPSVRLPTPLEWEYACRGGSTNSWPYGDKIKFTDANVRWDRGPPLSTWQAYYKSESVPFSGVRLGALQPVGYGAANRWGIVDMLGNASELVDDLEKTRMGMDGDSDVDHVRRCMVNWGMRVLPDYEPDKERLSSYWNRWAGFRFIIEEQAPAGGG